MHSVYISPPLLVSVLFIESPLICYFFPKLFLYTFKLCNCIATHTIENKLQKQDNSTAVTWWLGYKWSDLYIIVHISNSIFITLLKSTCPSILAKFQLHILIAFEITALKSSSSRKINLCSKHRENNLQVLTKTDVTYEWNNAQIRTLHHRVSHELRNGQVIPSTTLHCH